ncbi:MULTISPECIES: hypothetical protein [unclassified Bradyrhizobium]|nr:MULTISPECIES: hypothetical protein [unclassified Bradyrhizobium]MCK1415318.1 hypothetical protein [Bradyrhizobium sp. CW4]UPJ26559.1 hypothetical protein IVB54_33615 [Bradyrhizobium sp. CW1]
MTRSSGISTGGFRAVQVTQQLVAMDMQIDLLIAWCAEDITLRRHTEAA